MATKTLSQIYKKYFNDSLSRLFRDEWTAKKEESFNRLEGRYFRTLKKTLRENNEEELNAFIKSYLSYTGEISNIYLSCLCNASNVGTIKELPKEEQEEALNKINNCTYEELEEEIIKLIGVDSYKEILNKYIDEQREIVKTNDKQLKRNYYNPLRKNEIITEENKPTQKTIILAKYNIVSKELAKSIDNKEEFIKVQPIYDNPKIHAKTRTELNRVRNSIEAYLTTRKEEILFKRVKDKQKIIGYEIKYKDN
jgi:hypothetical protein